MQLSAETRNILRQYKALINTRRRDLGLSPVTTAKVVEKCVNPQPASVPCTYAVILFFRAGRATNSNSRAGLQLRLFAR